MHRLVLRAGAALFYSKVRKAFSSWDFIIQQQYRIAGAVQRMLHSRLSAAWNTWHAQAVQRRKFIKVLKRVANRASDATRTPLPDGWWVDGGFSMGKVKE